MSAPSGIKIGFTVAGWLADDDVLAVAESLRGCWPQLSTAQQRLALTVEIALEDVVATRYAIWLVRYAEFASELENGAPQ